VQIYHATRKAWWAASFTALKFFLTATLLGLATIQLTLAVARLEVPGRLSATLSGLVVTASVVKGLGELAILVHLGDKRHTELKRSALLLTRDLRTWLLARFAALVIGGIALPALNARGGSIAATVASFALLLAGELLERMLFFAAVSSRAMPGGLPGASGMAGAPGALP
jgi:DMSO reductase anchor subunit